MIQKLTTRGSLLVAAIAIAGNATANDAQLERLEQRLNSMQQQVNSLRADRVQWNGFLSTGIATASNDAGFSGVTESTSVADLSLFALQGTFRVSDRSQAVMQLVARGAEQWDPVMEWAYLSHRPTSDLQLRAGKMRIPFFMYSDSLELGYSQPWVRPPEAVYGPIAITSYVGADATRTFNLGGSSLDAQFFTGFTDEDGSVVDVELRNMAGVTLSWTDFVWTARGIAATAEISIDSAVLGILADRDRGNFFGLGLSYDDGTWQVISEVTRLEVDNQFADTDSAYLSVGRRFGAWTPYVMTGWIESKDDSDRLGQLSVLNTQRQEYSVGTRWDITPGVAIKADVTHARGFERNPGGLDPQYVLGTGRNSTNVYTLTLDSAF